jgi:hypothetical protein
MLDKICCRMLMATLVGVLPLAAAAAPLKILGFDDNSCQAWIAAKDEPEVRREYVAWARGFLSGHNYANQAHQVTDVSSSTVELYIERFCREKPKAQFIDGAYRMSDEYSGRGSPISK